MDSLPDALIQSILSNLRNAKDVASCKCVSKKFKDSMTFVTSLYFPRNVFDNLKNGQIPDSIITPMVSSVSRLEELVVYSPFTIIGLASWVRLAGPSLKMLELQMDNLVDLKTGYRSLSKLNSIQGARNLESLRLWGVLLLQAPKWDPFWKLRNLEIVGAKVVDSVLVEALRVTPELKQLVLLGCEGLRTVSIELLELEGCRLDFYGSGSCSLELRAPKLKDLQVQGCSWIRVRETSCLKYLSISNNAGKIRELLYPRTQI